MIESTIDSPEAAEAWNKYWSGVNEAEAYSVGGVSHPAIQAFWKQFFFESAQGFDHPEMFDIGSGDGALLDIALRAFGVEGVDITSIDVSEAAIEGIRQRFPGVSSMIANAASVPIDSGKFDIISSQFGIEYAGAEAFDEAARLLAIGGKIALVMHKENSCIHYECAQALDAINRLQESKFIPLAGEMFSKGFEAVRGKDRKPYDEAASRLSPAVESLEEILKQYGEHVAGDTIIGLYSGVADIHSNIQKYDPDEVLAWLKRLDGEMETFEARMSLMMECAMDKEAFELACASFEQAGCKIDQAGPLLAPDEDLPSAWVIVASRPLD